jgi:hypothetical protein
MALPLGVIVTGGELVLSLVSIVVGAVVGALTSWFLAKAKFKLRREDESIALNLQKEHESVTQSMLQTMKEAMDNGIDARGIRQAIEARLAGKHSDSELREFVRHYNLLLNGARQMARHSLEFVGDMLRLERERLNGPASDIAKRIENTEKILLMTQYLQVIAGLRGVKDAEDGTVPEDPKSALTRAEKNSQWLVERFAIVAGASPPKEKVIAKTGEVCPRSGIWRVHGRSVTAPIAKGNRMPPYDGRVTTWELDADA